MKRLSLLVLALLAFSLFAAEKPPAPPDVANPPADAQRDADGLITKQLIAGTGTEHPKQDDLVRIRYTVWKADGSLVQHVPAPQSVMLAVAKMVPGWASGVMKMVAGEKRRIWVSAELMKGKSDLGLLFDTELLDVVPRPTTPPDVAAPPADATKTESGLAYKVLRAGNGEKRPSRSSSVIVHYSGWTVDGRMFDSSVLRGDPATFRLDEVIRGWTEGLQLMQIGERTRFWIPAKLAYAGGGGPQGMLVFDVELIAIK